MLTDEQVEQIKGQLLKQIENFPEDRRDEIKEQVQEMNAEELEEFLIKNNLIKKEGQAPIPTGKTECVFCSIIEGKIPSYKLVENKQAVAILEINPLSNGHSLVLSKDHKKLASSALTLANKVSKRIKSKLNPEEVKIETSALFGHQIVQIIPIYKDIKLEKKQASEKELILLQEKLEIKKSEKAQKVKQERKVTELKPNLEKAPRRIP